MVLLLDGQLFSLCSNHAKSSLQSEFGFGAIIFAPASFGSLSAREIASSRSTTKSVRRISLQRTPTSTGYYRCTVRLPIATTAVSRDKDERYVREAPQDSMVEARTEYFSLVWCRGSRFVAYHGLDLFVAIDHIALKTSVKAKYRSTVPEHKGGSRVDHWKMSSAIRH